MTTSKDGTPGAGEGGNAENKTGELSAEALAAELKAKSEELAETLKKHNDAFQELRTVKTELATLKKSAGDREKDDNTKKGDAEALRKNFELELKAASDKAEAAERRYESAVVDSGVRMLCLEYGAEDAQSQQDLYELTRPHFKAGENGKLELKESPAEPSKWFKEQAEKRPHLAKNSRKGGSGTGNHNEKSGSKSTSIPPDLGTWSQADQAKWMRENPELAKQHMRNMGL